MPLGRRDKSLVVAIEKDEVVLAEDEDKELGRRGIYRTRLVTPM